MPQPLSVYESLVGVADLNEGRTVFEVVGQSSNPDVMHEGMILACCNTLLELALSHLSVMSPSFVVREYPDVPLDNRGRRMAKVLYMLSDLCGEIHRLHLQKEIDEGESVV